MGRPFTDCGNGSTLEATENVRKWLPRMAEKYGIRSVVDAGAGDLAWIELVEWDVHYIPVDLIPRRPEVARWDITTELLPLADAILCRHVLNHLAERLPQTVALFKRSEAKYLIATQYDAGENRTKQFQRCDLRPWFGEPLESIQDTSDELQRLAIWEIWG